VNGTEPSAEAPFRRYDSGVLHSGVLQIRPKRPASDNEQVYRRGLGCNRAAEQQNLPTAIVVEAGDRSLEWPNLDSIGPHAPNRGVLRRLARGSSRRRGATDARRATHPCSAISCATAGASPILVSSRVSMNHASFLLEAQRGVWARYQSAEVPRRAAVGT
jgi:hypothetical protein